MSKFFKLEVIKKSVAQVYIEMPNDVDVAEMMDYADAGRAALNTTNSLDWDDRGWEGDVEVLSAQDVTEEEAKKFPVFCG